MSSSQDAGNAAAMREALEKIEKMAHCDLCNVYPRYRDKFNGKIGGIEREAHAALAKPPRNCDRFADFNEAIRTFAKERPNDKKKWDMERYAKFAMWLLALTEKGETNGSK